MSSYQVVERSVGANFQQVRYQDYALKRFDTEEEAFEAASRYLTYMNVDNALAASEKQASAEAYMMTKDGAYLGVLDGKPWYMRNRHGDVVQEKNYYELEGKSEVAVKPLPGT